MNNKRNQPNMRGHQTSFNPNSTYDTMVGLSSTNGNTLTSAGFKTNQFKSTLAQQHMLRHPDVMEHLRLENLNSSGVQFSDGAMFEQTIVSNNLNNDKA